MALSARVHRVAIRTNHAPREHCERPIRARLDGPHFALAFVMRLSTALLSMVLVASLSASGFVLHRQRAALVTAGAHGADLERAVALQSAALTAKDADIAKLSASLARLEAERGAQLKALAELAELQRDRDATRARADQLTKFVEQFRKLIDAGKLSVEVRHGRLVLVLPNDVLFDEGKVALKPDGVAALSEIAATLKTVKDRQFQVIGHTDSTPIKTAAFPSNWELSSTRALAVVKLLVEVGVAPSVLAATGRGEFEPIAPNGNAFTRAKNRRIEIVLESPVGDLVKLGQLKM
jgi:chemotaxis protein MotB